MCTRCAVHAGLLVDGNTPASMRSSQGPNADLSAACITFSGTTSSDGSGMLAVDLGNEELVESVVVSLLASAPASPRQAVHAQPHAHNNNNTATHAPGACGFGRAQ